MLQAELLQEPRKLSVEERLALLEAALHAIRQDLRESVKIRPHPDTEKRLSAAADALLEDYQKIARALALVLSIKA